MIALLAPGQGSQSPGMLAPWLEDPAAAETVAAWSEATGLDLARLGTTADADEIKDTAVTQPLVVVNALLAAARLADALPASAPTAGHSVGELAAAAVAGVLTPDEAVRLAAIRGRAMADACALEPTGMAAVLGGEESVVLARLEALGLDPANRNGAGQIVAAGAQAAIEELEKEPPEGARRAAVLPVAGAFHTRFMTPAEDAVRAAAAELNPADPTRPLLTNSDGSVVKGGAAALDLLVAQVTRPVRWDSCMATLGELGVTAVLELPPAGTLVGLARRDLKGVKTLALKTPDDLEKAVALIEEHA
ncbi:malonyl CoA-acyl carrier protein transacylase [Pseudonocardia halophobica]|uniref:[acyl-carrier-protein] S-malonyltransferase n=1 Tax=Pseudonocardia halophobica TaxID=29401 RepID=A0A9W6L6G5_9PSEU|nr:ACP S-malonyltransferase [Pseudonocardia halophobica]GLL13972.1 malonyl CoA-acyl carrier protein transacylase [Pseudonocardia halophobica]